MDMTAAGGFPYTTGDHVQYMLLAVVDNRVNRIEPQAVQIELIDPIKCIVDNHVADCFGALAIEVDGGPPGRFLFLGEDRRILRQVMSVRTEVVVDHIEKYCDV